MNFFAPAFVTIDSSLDTATSIRRTDGLLPSPVLSMYADSAGRRAQYASTRTLRPAGASPLVSAPNSQRSSATVRCGSKPSGPGRASQRSCRTSGCLPPGDVDLGEGRELRGRGTLPANPQSTSPQSGDLAGIAPLLTPTSST